LNMRASDREVLGCVACWSIDGSSIASATAILPSLPSSVLALASSSAPSRVLELARSFWSVRRG
jgi:hypothetical protein